ncbi:hypothetical protein L6164_001686 [Bauhinia variegata]|uniref:Uncharacterized protein n=1 Tax=Bauhinia variegata TaxID=167791 RepID=A0ACB9QAB2_BAUVA|nr:hypothetical protein L6164_001686 [Bauhinia variegata]
MAPAYLFRFFPFSQLVLLLLAGGGIGKQEKCSISFNCGSLGALYFPFTTTEHQDCGLLAIKGCDDPSSSKMIQLEKDGRFFEVIEVSKQNNSIIIFDKNLHKLLLSRSCEVFHNDFTLPLSSPMVSFYSRYIRTFYRCDHTVNVPRLPSSSISNFTCPHYIYYYRNSLEFYVTFTTFSKCSMIQLPGKQWRSIVHEKGSPGAFNRLSAYISIEVRLSDDCYSCHYQRGGQCRLDRRGNFYCAKGNMQIK